MPLNIALGELERLTLRDSIEVEGNVLTRWKNRLQTFRSRVAALNQVQTELQQREAEAEAAVGKRFRLCDDPGKNRGSNRGPAE
ncbi:MAG: hypothetical protein U5K37_05230 [Natrialbaceae archaeon]|nr:hypothetical protein [Natrialbaceae archaeon]